MSNVNATDTQVLLRADGVLYYVMKVIVRGFDVYCIPVHFGMHISLHESGQTHFTIDSNEDSSDGGLLALMAGEAGTPSGRGFMTTSLRDVGRAVGICTAMFSVESPSTDFEPFTRDSSRSFVIERSSIIESGNEIEIGVWAVPARNEPSFYFNNSGLSDKNIFKLDQVEPQIWIYVRPLFESG